MAIEGLLDTKIAGSSAATSQLFAFAIVAGTANFSILATIRRLAAGRR